MLLFNQFFASVDLEAGTAFYIDSGATNEYTDALGRRWQSDAPFLATSSSGAALTVFAIGPITNTLTGDRYLPDAMLNSERWFNGHIRYQAAVPNGWYSVLLYFSEYYPPGVSPALGGTDCATCARIFDLEVEGQRTNAYNQADAIAAFALTYFCSTGRLWLRQGSHAHLVHTSSCYYTIRTNSSNLSKNRALAAALGFQNNLPGVQDFQTAFCCAFARLLS